MFEIYIYKYEKTNDKSSLSSCDFAWAYYSDSKETLLNICLNKVQNKFTWNEGKSLGIGYWLKTFKLTNIKACNSTSSTLEISEDLKISKFSTIKLS